MPLRRPEDFVREGSKVFRQAPVNRASIEGWIAISKGKVADAQRSANSASTRLGAAYDSVFNLSLAVLCKHGWRCTAADGPHAQGLGPRKRPPGGGLSPAARPGAQAASRFSIFALVVLSSCGRRCSSCWNSSWCSSSSFSQAGRSMSITWRNCSGVKGRPSQFSSW